MLHSSYMNIIEPRLGGITFCLGQVLCFSSWQRTQFRARSQGLTYSTPFPCNKSIMHLIEDWRCGSIGKFDYEMCSRWEKIYQASPFQMSAQSKHSRYEICCLLLPDTAPSYSCLLGQKTQWRMTHLRWAEPGGTSHLMIRFCTNYWQPRFYFFSVDFVHLHGWFVGRTMKNKWETREHPHLHSDSSSDVRNLVSINCSGLYTSLQSFLKKISHEPSTERW